MREAAGVHVTHELPNLALHLGGIGHLVRHKRTEDIRGLPRVSKRAVLLLLLRELTGTAARCGEWR